MSYDLMVFAPEVAPKGEAAFLEWYWVQTRWGEGHPAIGNLRRYQQPSLTRRGSYSSKARETIGFTFQGRPYDFQRYRFRSDREFESFCRLITECVRSVTRAE